MPKVSVCVDVPDKTKAIDFYVNALGCECVNIEDEYAELSTNNITIYLGEKVTGSNPLINGNAIRNYERHWTPVHMDFVVSDFDQCVSSIVEQGGIKEGENSGDWGAIAFCSDPFGNGFCVLQYKQ